MTTNLTEALMANAPGAQPGEPIDERLLATTCVKHPDHPTVVVTMRIYAPAGWDGEVLFTEDSAVVDGVAASVDDMRRGWFMAGGE